MFPKFLISCQLQTFGVPWKCLDFQFLLKSQRSRHLDPYSSRAASAGAAKLLLPVAGACWLQVNPALFWVTCLNPSGIWVGDVCFREVCILKGAVLNLRKRTTIWGTTSVCACLVAKLCLTLCDPCQAPLSMEFLRQEYWSGLLLPSPADLPDPGIEATSPALQANSLPSEPQGKPFRHQ